MKGVILAAGKGTRMSPLTERRPKPLVPVLDRPMIEHIIIGARDAGVDHIGLVVGYLGHMIQEACGDGSDLGVRIEYIRQEHAGGTGAATLLAADFIGDDPFFLSWGDIIVAPETYRHVTRLWQDEQPDAVLSLNVVPDPWEGAAVYVVDGFIEKIIEKPEPGTSTTNYNNAGIFVFPPDILALLGHTPPSARGEVEVPDAIQAMLGGGARIRGVEVVGYWSDVARPSSVLELNRTIINHRAADGVIIVGETYVDDRVQLTPPVFIGPDCHVGAAALGPNVTLGAGTVVEDGAVLEEVATFGHCRIGAEVRLKYVLVEEGALVGGHGAEGNAEAPQIIRRD